MSKEFNFKKSKRVGDKFKGKEIKVSITTRLDPKVVTWLREESDHKGMSYQTYINFLLTEAMNSGDQEEKLRKIVREELAKKTG